MTHHENKLFLSHQDSLDPPDPRAELPFRAPLLLLGGLRQPFRAHTCGFRAGSSNLMALGAARAAMMAFFKRPY